MLLQLKQLSSDMSLMLLNLTPSVNSSRWYCCWPSVNSSRWCCCWHITLLLNHVVCVSVDTFCQLLPLVLLLHWKQLSSEMLLMLASCQLFRMLLLLTHSVNSSGLYCCWHLLSTLQDVVVDTICQLFKMLLLTHSVNSSGLYCCWHLRQLFKIFFVVDTICQLFKMFCWHTLSTLKTLLL